MTAVLFFLAAIALLYPLDRLGRLREMHHGYAGWLVALLGRLLGGWVGFVLFALGVVAWADDTYQHWRQLHEPDYRSPLHRGYGWLYARLAWMRALNAWLDHLLGK
jgi:vacuolar-type H+-ATPase subunit I/STV1